MFQTWRQGGKTYDEQLVGSLLPLLVHGVRSRVGEETDHAEDTEGDTNTGNGAPEDLSAAARRVLGAGAVRAESDPVSCEMSVLLFSVVAWALRRAIEGGGDGRWTEVYQPMTGGPMDLTTGIEARNSITTATIDVVTGSKLQSHSVAIVAHVNSYFHHP